MGFPRRLAQTNSQAQTCYAGISCCQRNPFHMRHGFRRNPSLLVKPFAKLFAGSCPAHVHVVPAQEIAAARHLDSESQSWVCKALFACKGNTDDSIDSGLPIINAISCDHDST